MRRPESNVERKSPAWRLLIVLLAGSLLAIALPSALTQRMANLVQMLVPFQDAINGAVGAGARALAGDSSISEDEASRRLDALRSAVVLLSAQNRSLRIENERLTGVRDRGLGPRGRLIPARVVADDAVPWRNSKLILLRGASRNDAVISRHFSIDLAADEGVHTGMGVLATEVLVGIIEQAGTLTSRVRLLSDPGTRMSVAIGRVDGTDFTAVDGSFWLVGGGHGRIEIRDVHHQYVNDGDIRLGDVVLTRRDDPRLPPSVTIGTIVDMETDPDNGLLYILHVDPGVELESIRRVYVVDTRD